MTTYYRNCGLKAIPPSSALFPQFSFYLLVTLQLCLGVKKRDLEIFFRIFPNTPFLTVAKNRISDDENHQYARSINYHSFQSSSTKLHRLPPHMYVNKVTEGFFEFLFFTKKILFSKISCRQTPKNDKF